MKTPRYWRPLVRSYVTGPASPELVAVSIAAWGCDEAEARRRLAANAALCEYWVNHLYQVEKRPCSHGFVQLNIRRRDGAALHDWRHFQQIKNELVGPECEAVELYPAESRLVDTTNKYHLWCCTDPAFRFPVGFEQRDVQDEDRGNARVPGLRQRAL